MEYRVSIYDGSNGVILVEYPDGSRFGDGQGDIKVDNNVLNEALDKLKEAVDDTNNN